jgi:hypothetical protein
MRQFLFSVLSGVKSECCRTSGNETDIKYTKCVNTWNEKQAFDKVA